MSTTAYDDQFKSDPDATVYVDGGHLREVLNGNDMPAFMSTEPQHGLVALRTARSWDHATNEWADMATNGLQWVKNIRDGISTADEAVRALELDLEHCREVRDAAPTQSTHQPDAKSVVGMKFTDVYGRKFTVVESEQQPMDPEAEKILKDNFWELYARDKAQQPDAGEPVKYPAMSGLPTYVSHHEVRCLIDEAVRLNRAPIPVPDAGEPVAWLHTCTKPGKRTQWASLDRNENPADQWETHAVQALGLIEAVPVPQVAQPEPQVSEGDDLPYFPELTRLSSNYGFTHEQMRAYARAAIDELPKRPQVAQTAEGEPVTHANLKTMVDRAHKSMEETLRARRAPPHSLIADSGDAKVRRDTLLAVLIVLNSNPYSLTKAECVDVVRGMFDKADAATAAKGKA